MLDIPFGAVWLLDAMALRYQALFVDADEVRAFADTVREFAKRVTETNDEGAKVVGDLGLTWEGASYNGFVSAWDRMGATMPELEDACEFLASALEVAAVVIEITQAAVIAELAALGAMFVGGIAASAATFGTSVALSLAVRTAANRLIRAMQEVLIAYLLNEVMELAIKPLENLIERIVSGYGNAALAHDPGPATVFRMDPDELDRAANFFDHLADQMSDHGRWLSEQLGGLFLGGDEIGDFGVDSDLGGSTPPPNVSTLPYVGDLPPEWDERTPYGPSIAQVGSDLEPSSAPPFQPAAGYTEPGAQAPSLAVGPGGPGPQPADISSGGPELLDGQDRASQPGILADAAATPDRATETPWQHPDAVASAAEPSTSAEPSASAAQDHTTGPVDDGAPRDHPAVPTSPGNAPDPWASAGQGPPPGSGGKRPAARRGRPRLPASRAARRRKPGGTPWTREPEHVVAAQQDSAKVIAPATTWTPWSAAAPKATDAPKATAQPGRQQGKPEREKDPPDGETAADATATHDNTSADPKTPDGPPHAAVLAPPVHERART